MDAAYSNALAKRQALAEEMRTLSERLSEASAELGRADEFLRAYAEFAGIEPLAEVKTSPAPSSDKPKRQRPVNPPKEKIGDHVAAYLEEFQRPLSRDRIFSLLEQSGIDLKGTDPKMVLSTMLWRMKDRFVRYPGRGYWFADRPLPHERSIFGDTDNPDS